MARRQPMTAAAARADADPPLSAAQHARVKHSVHHMRLTRQRAYDAAVRNPIECPCQVMTVTPAVPSKRRGANSTLLFTMHAALKGCPHSELERTADRRRHLSMRRQRIAIVVSERRRAARRIRDGS
jgi:hypothetical protein